MCTMLVTQDNREYISIMDYAELQPLQAMQVRHGAHGDGGSALFT